MLKLPKSEYWNGSKNKAIRYWYYIVTGLDLFNQFRYLILAIAGLCFWLQLKNPMFFLLIFIISCVILGLFGWMKIHHMGKTMDYLNIEFSTHFGRYGYELQEKQIELLKKIVEEMKHE